MGQKSVIRWNSISNRPPTSAQLSRAVKADEISVVEPLNHCVLLDNPKNNKGLGLSQPHSTNISKNPFDVEENDKQVIVLPETKERITQVICLRTLSEATDWIWKTLQDYQRKLDLDDVEDGNLVQTGEDSQKYRESGNCSRLELAEKIILQLQKYI